MYSWQMVWELGNFGLFGIGIMPGTYACAANEFIKGLLIIPHFIIFDPNMTAYWGMVLEDPNAGMEVEEEDDY